MKRELFIEKLLDAAKRAGFDQAEAFLSEGEAFEATAHEGKVNSYEVSASFGLGFRGLYQGRMGYASTQVMDEEAVGQLIEGAKTNALLMDEAETETLYQGAQRYGEVNGFHPALEQVSAASKLEKLLALEKAALSLDPRVTQLGDCGLMTSSGALRIVNSLGLDVSHKDNLAGMYLSATARENEKTNSGFRYAFGFGFDALDADKLAREAVQEAVDGLAGEPVPSGSYPIVFRNDAAASLLGTFAGVFSGEAAEKGLSLLAGREGEMIAAQCVSIVDDPLLPGGYASMPFDGEGVATYSKNVIERGALRTLLHNRKTAAKKGVSSTGNAARSYAGRVGVSPRNFFFMPGAEGLDALLKRADGGLFITEVQGLHAGANAVTGDFSLGAKGYRIESGRIAAPVSGITVAGNFFAMLGQIEALGNDLTFGMPGGACYGSPAILAGKLTVAGR